MRRFRNPRYAPEGLERKLNPSGISLPVAAEVAPATSNNTSALAELATIPAPAPSDPASLALVGSSASSTSSVIQTRSAAAYDPPPPSPTPTPTPLDPWGEPLPPSSPDEPD